MYAEKPIHKVDNDKYSEINFMRYAILSEFFQSVDNAEIWHVGKDMEML